jgi:hypothetical protein
MQFAAQLEVRNPRDSITVLTPNPEHPDVYYKFEGCGHEGGEDTHFIPREHAALPNFTRAVRNGLLEVVDLDPKDPLSRMLKVREGVVLPENRPLTVERIIFNEEGKPESHPIPVRMNPLVKED